MAGRRRNVNIGANSIVYSGRGRPRKEVPVTTAAVASTNNRNGYGDRPLPVGIVLGSPSSPATADLYKDRKIRVGGPFQARVPKYRNNSNNSSSNDHSTEDGSEGDSGPDVSSRPAPLRLSRSHPHLTQDEEIYHEQRMEEERQQKAEASINQLVAATEGKILFFSTNDSIVSNRMNRLAGQGETLVLINEEWRFRSIPRWRPSIELNTIADLAVFGHWLLPCRRADVQVNRRPKSHPDDHRPLLAILLLIAGSQESVLLIYNNQIALG